VKDLSDEVREGISEIVKKRDEAGRQLALFGQRKKAAYAYARNT
jgi:hypothetical protein